MTPPIASRRTTTCSVCPVIASHTADPVTAVIATAIENGPREVLGYRFPCLVSSFKGGTVTLRAIQELSPNGATRRQGCAPGVQLALPLAIERESVRGMGWRRRPMPAAPQLTVFGFAADRNIKHPVVTVFPRSPIITSLRAAAASRLSSGPTPIPLSASVLSHERSPWARMHEPGPLTALKSATLVVAKRNSIFGGIAAPLSAPTRKGQRLWTTELRTIPPPCW
jgi:hypothetical protein